MARLPKASSRASVSCYHVKKQVVNFETCAVNVVEGASVLLGSWSASLEGFVRRCFIAAHPVLRAINLFTTNLNRLFLQRGHGCRYRR